MAYMKIGEWTATVQLVASQVLGEICQGSHDRLDVRVRELASVVVTDDYRMYHAAAAYGDPEVYWGAIEDRLSEDIRVGDVGDWMIEAAIDATAAAIWASLQEMANEHRKDAERMRREAL